MKYDIFISYKRKGTSSATAAYLYELLQQKGYNVFFDRKELRSGRFNEQLLEHISNATDIIILLEEESLGAWFDNRTPKESISFAAEGISDRNDSDADLREEPYKTDWFCKEVMYALSLEGKNIVPILLNGYGMPEGKDLPPEMKDLSLHQALSLEISEVEEFYEKYFVEQGYLKSKPANLSLTKRFQSRGGVVGCFLFYTEADSCDLYECGDKIATLTDDEDEWHPFRYPVNFAGEHRFRAVNNDSCEIVTIRCSVETNCQQYVQVQFNDTRNLWKLTREEINAQEDAGRLYDWGRGLFAGTSKHDPDITLSFECFSRAISLGSQEALSFVSGYGTGLVTEKHAPLDVVIKWYTIAAEQGNHEAQRNLGYVYLKGKGVGKDVGKAFELYSKAAEQGNMVAQRMLGHMYFKGIGVGQDYAKAFEWFQKGASQGCAYSQERLGWMYYKGLGVSRDYGKAFEWYTKAAEQGDSTGQKALGHLYYKGLGVGRDYDKAFEWSMKAAEQGEAFSQRRIGEMYFRGLGVDQDYDKAFVWTMKAAEQGDASAQRWIGEMYLRGHSVGQDDGKALEWFLKAAEQGDSLAQRMIGSLYSEGRGVEQDYGKALEWFLKAAESGRPSALNSVAWTYHLTGEYEKALPWAEKAVEARPDDPNVVDTLATVYEGLGRDEEALEQFEKCLRMYEEKGNEEGKQHTVVKINALKEKMTSNQ